ncbi:MAG TPA: ferritin-like domain-containing protein [Actinomycetota bacterium]|nr:ferritin-like domain-containing protein [Actinomycetota bacterium]
MSTRQYTLPVDQTRWEVGADSTTTFNWEYDETRDRLLALYEKGKEKQWNTNTRLDWSVDVDPGSGENAPDYYIPIYGSDMWERMDEPARRELRHHMAAWLNSQFLHGEQGALICTAKIVQTCPDIDSKFYAATQVMDEARHMETYSRYLREKVGMAYPINAHLKSLLNDIVSDPRWDMTNLGMQVMVEGLALAAFSMIRDFSQEPLAKALNAYVMQDEARHVAFGRLALREYYPQLTEAERGEREEFVVYASYLMRDRFLAEEVWESIGLDKATCIEFVKTSEMMVQFRRMLFSRIVPTVKDLGLFGPKVRKAFEDMGVIDFQDVNPDDLSAEDEAIAAELEQRRGNPNEDVATAALAGIDAARAAEVAGTIEAGAEDG